MGQKRKMQRKISRQISKENTSYNNTKDLVLCMIVKNEEKNIINNLTQNCLIEEIKHVCIVDTGSTDKTVELCHTFFNENNINGKVIEHSFFNCDCHNDDTHTSNTRKYGFFDFAENRSYAIQQAYIHFKDTCDFIFMTDTDDHLETHLPNGSTSSSLKVGLKDYVKKYKNKYNIFFIPFGIKRVAYKRPLIFPNNGLCKFDSALHEYLSYIKPFPQLSFNIVHSFSNPNNKIEMISGRTGERSMAKDKYKKDAMFFEAMINDSTPQNNKNYWRYVYYCGQSWKDYYSEVKDFMYLDYAEKYFRMHISALHHQSPDEISRMFDQETYNAYKFVIQFYLMYNKPLNNGITWKNLIELCDKSVEECGNASRTGRAETLYFKALIYMNKLKNLKEAYNVLKHIKTNITFDPNLLFNDRGMYDSSLALYSQLSTAFFIFIDENTSQETIQRLDTSSFRNSTFVCSKRDTLNVKLTNNCWSDSFTQYTPSSKLYFVDHEPTTDNLFKKKNLEIYYINTLPNIPQLTYEYTSIQNMYTPTRYINYKYKRPRDFIPLLTEQTNLEQYDEVCQTIRKDFPTYTQENSSKDINELLSKVSYKESLIPKIVEEGFPYNEEVVELLTFRPLENYFNKHIMLSITSCKRMEFFEKTINSILNRVPIEELKLITTFFCVDDGSSEEERDRMKELYPFFTFHFTPLDQDGNGKGHSNSMNVIYQKCMKNEVDYLLHLEDDFMFHETKNYISDALKILRSDDKVSQVVFNRHDQQVDMYKRPPPSNLQPFYNVIEGKDYPVMYSYHLSNIIRNLPLEYSFNPNLTQSIHNKMWLDGLSENGIFSYTNTYYWKGFTFMPSMIDVSRTFKLQGPFSTQGFFEGTYSSELFWNTPYYTAHLNSFSIYHLGRLAGEKDSTTPNAYDLNKKNQYSSNNEENGNEFVVITSRIVDPEYIEFKKNSIRLDDDSINYSVFFYDDITEYSPVFDSMKSVDDLESYFQSRLEHHIKSNITKTFKYFLNGYKERLSSLKNDSSFFFKKDLIGYDVGRFDNTRFNMTKEEMVRKCKELGGNCFNTYGFVKKIENVTNINSKLVNVKLCRGMGEGFYVC